MANSSETKGTTTTNTASSGGTTTGGGGGKGPGPKKILEIALLFAILILVAYDTYMISQNHQLLQSRQAVR